MCSRVSNIATSICLWLIVSASFAQQAAPSTSYPNRPVRVVVPLPPGGGQDAVGRILVPGLSEAFGVPFFVDNRPGAGQTIGTDMVARAAPDGYTLMMAGAAFTIAQFTYTSVAYDVEKDFAPITQVAFQPLFLAINSSVKAGTIQELIMIARARPGELNLALGDPGGSGAMAAEMFKMVTNTKMVSVPYKGGPLALMALMSNEVQVLFTTPTSAIQHLKSGKLKILGTTGKERAPYLPDVPTLTEAGLKDVDVGPWQGLVAPIKTTSGVIDRLYRQVVEVLQQPSTRERLAASGADIIIGSSPKEFALLINHELAQNGKVIKAAGLKAE